MMIYECTNTASHLQPVWRVTRLEKNHPIEQQVLDNNAGKQLPELATDV
jgi:hypothetical protein